MDPYIHAGTVRGEGFRVDEIDNLDQFAVQQDALEKALQERPQKRILERLKHFL